VKERIQRLLAETGRVFDRLRATRADTRLFLVGGALRDLVLGRTPEDLDFAVSGSGIRFASDFARRIRAKLVVLSEEDDEARVVWRRSLTLDFNGLGDRTIAEDLGRRDFTINALACEVLPDGVGELLDPFGGRADIEQRLIRPVSGSSLRQDPLRLLRAVRLALELGFELDPEVHAQAGATSLRATAAERIGVELLRIMEQPGSFRFVEDLVRLGRLQEILPALGDVLDDPELRGHTLRTYRKIEEIIAAPGFFGRFQPEWETYFDRWTSGDETDTSDAARPRADTSGEPEPTEKPALPFRRALLKLAGLLHDVAKPATRFTTTGGEVHFYGHDSIGARQTAQLARDRLRLSRPQTKMLRTLVQEHMRLHLLATAPDLSERAIRRYFRDVGQEAFGLMILCFADGWATAGRTLHLEDTITRMLEQKRAEDAMVKVERLVTGHDLIALGLKPGPAFKTILEELENLQIEGRIKTTEEGIAYLSSAMPGLFEGAGR